MIHFGKLLELLRKGWTHPVYDWRGVSSTWPTDAHGLQFSNDTGSRAMRLEYPRGSGRYLDIEDITDNGVEVYDADDERFYIEADIKPSDLRVARLEQSSFAYWFSQHVGLGKKKPEQIEPGLFRLPMPDAYVFLGLEVEAKRCMEQLRHIRTKVKGEAVLITICPYTNLMCFQEGPMDIRLFPFLDVVHVNETGVAEKCDLKDSLHGAGRKEIRGSLRGFELPPDAVWEAICIEISTTSIHDAAYEDMFKDKVRFSFLRNGE